MVDSIVLLVAFSIIYIFIIEIFTVLFRLTGMTEDVARFQVISLLTACGFTTSQSETITMSKRRRRLASVTIIFGYIFSLIIVSVVVNVFLSMSAAQINTFIGIGVAFTIVFLVIFILIKSKKAKLHFDDLINKIYTRLSHKKSNNIVIVDVFGHKLMAHVYLTQLPSFLKDTPLKEAGLVHKHGIQILLLNRNGETVDLVDGNTQLLLNDDIIVFGREKDIYKVFDHTLAVKAKKNNENIE